MPLGCSCNSSEDARFILSYLLVELLQFLQLLPLVFLQLLHLLLVLHGQLQTRRRRSFRVSRKIFETVRTRLVPHPLPLVQELLGVAAVQLSHSPLPLRLVFDALVLADGFAVLHGHLGLVGTHLFALSAIARVHFVQ